MAELGWRDGNGPSQPQTNQQHGHMAKDRFVESVLPDSVAPIGTRFDVQLAGMHER